MAPNKKMSPTLDQLVIFAVRGDCLEILQRRVAEGGSVNYVDPKHGSALSEAIRKANLSILDWLIENGADVNVEYRDAIGPLEVALACPDPIVVRKLVFAGAKLKRTTRPYYRQRLEQCLLED